MYRDGELNQSGAHVPPTLAAEHGRAKQVTQSIDQSKRKDTLSVHLCSVTRGILNESLKHNCHNPRLMNFSSH